MQRPPVECRVVLPDATPLGRMQSSAAPPVHDAASSNAISLRRMQCFQLKPAQKSGFSYENLALGKGTLQSRANPCSRRTAAPRARQSPALSVESQTLQSANEPCSGLAVNLAALAAVGSRLTPPFKMPVSFCLTSPGRSKRRCLWASRSFRRFLLPASFKTLAVAGATVQNAGFLPRLVQIAGFFSRPCSKRRFEKTKTGETNA